MCEHMVEKFANKDAKKGNFNNQMQFRKKSIALLILEGRLPSYSVCTSEHRYTLEQ